MRLREWAVLAMSGLYVGCGGHGGTTSTPVTEKPPGTKALDSYSPAPLANATDVHAWAEISSSPAIYLTTLPVLIALNPIGGDKDTTCPVVTKDAASTTTTTTGDCTAKDGTKWFGTMVQVGATSTTGPTTSSAQVTYKGFGTEQAVTTCSGKSGTSKTLLEGTQTVEPTSDASTSRFTYNLVITHSGLDDDTCTADDRSLAFEYEGTLKSTPGSGGGTSGNNSHSVWAGSGRVGDSSRGVVMVNTADEVTDSSVCSSEALSGTTTLQSGTHQARIQYDGQTDCQEKSTVKWSLDGSAPATLEGISCSAATGAALPFWGLLGALGLVRRRVRR